MSQKIAYAVIEAIINLTVSLALVKPLGIYGVLIGTIVAAAFRTPILIWYASKHIIKRKTISYWKKIFCWLPVFIGCYFISEYLPIYCSSLIHWAMVSVVVGIVVLTFCLIWAMIFDKNVRQEIKQLLSKIKSKLKRKSSEGIKDE